MYKISHAKITGVWGWNNIETDFHDDVSVFIGSNGTGKTTFINILVAILRVDVAALEELWFDSATLVFEGNVEGKKKKRTLTISRQSGNKYNDESVSYKISRVVYDLPFLNGRHVRSIHVQRKVLPAIENIKGKLQEIISFSSLSVSRAGLSDIDDLEYLDSRKDINQVNSIDSILSDLLTKLKVYQLKKAQESKEIAREFQEEVLISVLYDKDIDSSVGLNELAQTDFQEEMRNFTTSYNQLGIQNTLRRGKAKELISKHFNAIQESVTYLQEAIAENKGVFEVDKIFAFPLLKRTKKILQAGKAAEKRRKILFSSLEVYKKELQKYFKGKSITLLADGGLYFKDSNRAGSEYDYTKLSSGEKQILILLTESLLQDGESKLFIADEPELSLHVDWQSKILPSIRLLNNSAQIIVATHSPEVAGEYPENILDMEDICYE
ncbi:AAA family ATPase [Pectobacterium sp. CHL-2024]|uniref:AAA family ATPase n=1 Tax=Pectobacterium sp. CHL-2024 TaxID=3377079 RepID=UPI0037F8FF8D